MHYTRWISILVVLLVIATSFFPWVVIVEKNISISGIAAEGTRWGKPGYFSILLSGIVLLLAFIPRIWAQRISLFTAAFNIGWALRNFFLLSACSGGICPQRQPAIYAYLALSIGLIISIIFQKMQLKPAADD